MYKNILVPIAADHNPDTGRALAAARLLADDGAKITALTVVEEIPPYVASQLPEGQLDHTREEVLIGLKGELGGATDVHPVVVTGHAARSILEYANEHGADCIVVASHRPSFQDFFLGSTAARVVQHAQCAVHVIR